VELHRPAAREALALLHRRRPLLLLRDLLWFGVFGLSAWMADGSLHLPTCNEHNTSGAVDFSDRSCIQSCTRVLVLFVLGLAEYGLRLQILACTLDILDLSFYIFYVRINFIEERSRGRIKTWSTQTSRRQLHAV
jgi:hypothetical protein